MYHITLKAWKDMQNLWLKSVQGYMDLGTDIMKSLIPYNLGKRCPNPVTRECFLWMMQKLNKLISITPIQDWFFFFAFYPQISQWLKNGLPQVTHFWIELKSFFKGQPCKNMGSSARLFFNSLILTIYIKIQLHCFVGLLIYQLLLYLWTFHDHSNIQYIMFKCAKVQLFYLDYHYLDTFLGGKLYQMKRRKNITKGHMY